MSRLRDVWETAEDNLNFAHGPLSNLDRSPDNQQKRIEHWIHRETDRQTGPSELSPSPDSGGPPRARERIS